MKLKFAIALTGCIGSGKSSVSAILKNRAFAVICADEVSHACLENSQDEIVGAFGEQILESGAISRKKLGEIVFSDSQKRKVLESILHPKIRNEILSLAKALEAQILKNKQANTESKSADSYTKPFYFLDIPLFFEIGGKSAYDVAKIILVYAPKDVCLKRIIKRDKISQLRALERINAQMDIEQKRAKSDFVIENLGDLQNLDSEVSRVLKQLDSEIC